MKKSILAAAFIAIAMASCQEKTKEKVNDANEAVQTEAEQKFDTIDQNIDNAIDSTKVKTGEALEKGAEKMDKAGDNLKDSGKK